MSILDKIFKKSTKSNDKKYDVFISYSTKDHTEADKVRYILEENGVKCWIAPRDLLAGESFTTQIAGALKNSKADVLIYSMNACESKYVAQEIRMAFKEKMPIIAFNIDGSFPDDEMERYLTSLNWIVACPPSEEAYEILVDAVLRAISH